MTLTSSVIEKSQAAHANWIRKTAVVALGNRWHFRWPRTVSDEKNSPPAHYETRFLHDYPLYVCWDTSLTHQYPKIFRKRIIKLVGWCYLPSVPSGTSDGCACALPFTAVLGVYKPRVHRDPHACPTWYLILCLCPDTGFQNIKAPRSSAETAGQNMGL